MDFNLISYGTKLYVFTKIHTSHEPEIDDREQFDGPTVLTAGATLSRWQ